MDMASRHLGHVFHRLLLVLLLRSAHTSALAIHAAADHLRKRTQSLSSSSSTTSTAPSSITSAAAAASSSTSPSGGSENPRLSLALKICFGLFAAIFTLSIIFCAIRSAQQGRREPKVDADVRVQDLREVTAETAVEREVEVENLGENLGEAAVRVPERVLVAEERVRSWVMEQEVLVNGAVASRGEVKI